MLKKYPPDLGQWEKLVFWGDEEPEERFWGNIGQLGLFGGSRILIVRHAQDWSAQVWKNVSQVLGSCRDNVWPVFSLESPWEKGKFKLPAHILKTKCMHFAEKKGWVWKNPGLNTATLAKYAEAEAGKLGLSFSRDALALFCETVSPNAAGVDNELKKLSLASTDGQITRDMVNADGANPEADAFACIQKLERGDVAGVWKELGHDQGGKLLFFLIALMARELRAFWQINCGVSVYLPPNVAAAKKKLANALGAGGIGEGFAALADAEWQVKSGRLDPDQAMETLATRLAKLFKP